ncbi:helix-turn-helix domain-containing protein [Cryobacterium sp. BB307]|uniref:TetR/AcrR family transcriptional regulator n=1 Tax=unclassified Cryobacterium TaxID=2649013 RepID=UPI0032C0B3A2
MTIVESDPTSQRAPWAKQRILDTATRLFYDEGIRQVGIDRLIAEAETTKATFYKYYRAKAVLVAAYIRGAHERDKAALEALIVESDGAAQALELLVQRIIDELQRPGFRGCLYLNAAAEYPEPHHEVRVIIMEHRDWYTAAIADLLRQVGHPLPGEGADDFLLARDGAMVGGYAGDVTAAAGALQRSVDRIRAARA